MLDAMFAEDVKDDTIDRKLILGIIFGLIAAMAWASYTVASRAGLTSGLTALDLTGVRFIVAGLILSPFVFREGFWWLAGLGWRRGLILTFLSGPPFILLYIYGLGVTPYTHGPVITPSVVALGALAMATIFLGEQVSFTRLLGTTAVLAGLCLVVGGDVFLGLSASLSIYDLMFVAAGFLWAGYTILLRRWKIAPVSATAVVALLSMFAIAPFFVAMADFAKLAAAPADIITQAFMQGMVAAIIAVIAFNKAVSMLGAARAGLFPSLVPVFATVLGIPFLGEWPTMMQVLGIGAATIGLVLASGVLDGGDRIHFSAEDHQQIGEALGPVIRDVSSSSHNN